MKNMVCISKPEKETLTFDELTEELFQLHKAAKGEIDFIANVITPTITLGDIHFVTFEESGDKEYYKFRRDMLHLDEASCMDIIFDKNSIVRIIKNSDTRSFYEICEPRYLIEQTDGYSIVIYVEY